jgi:hypothetical protein
VNTSEIIAALKIKGSFPTSDDLFSDSDFLVLLNLSMNTDITAIMMKLNDEYLLATKDYTIAAGTTYRLPTRVVTIRDITLFDGSGNITPLNRCFEEDRGSGKSGYYIVRNSIELTSDITSGTMRLKYFARPNKLVATSACGQIESINTVANSLVVTTAPSTFVNGASVDLIQNNNPYDLLAMDTSISSIAGTTLTFSSLPTDLAVGDWVAIANQSPVPLAPEELHALLIQAALVTSLSSKKDKKYEDEKNELEMMKTNIINLLDPRVNNSSVKMRSGALFTYWTNRRY